MMLIPPAVGIADYRDGRHVAILADYVHSAKLAYRVPLCLTPTLLLAAIFIIIIIIIYYYYHPQTS